MTDKEISEKYQIPINCDNCNVKLNGGGWNFQGSLCHRCPVFNCMGEDKLMDISDYREDWLNEFQEWFKKDTPLNDTPRLKFNVSEI